MTKFGVMFKLHVKTY